MKRLPNEEKINFLHMVSTQLVEYFARPLFDLSNEKNYHALVCTIEQIIDWSHDLSDKYYFKTTDWKQFQSSGENIFEAESLEEFVFAFGLERFNIVAESDNLFSNTATQV
jgi:hypothetical protein